MSPRGQEQKPSRPPRRKKRRGWRRRLLVWGGAGLGLLLLAGSIYIGLLAREIRSTFEGRLWADPSRLYSSPLTLRAGETTPPAKLQGHLERSRYARAATTPRAPGQ